EHAPPLRVEAHERAVAAAHALGGAHHDGVIDFALLDAAARRCILDAHLDHVADRGIAALRAAQHLDAHDGARAGIVGNVQHGLHLNHDFSFAPTFGSLTRSLGPR